MSGFPSVNLVNKSDLHLIYIRAHRLAWQLQVFSNEILIGITHDVPRLFRV